MHYKKIFQHVRFFQEIHFCNEPLRNGRTAMFRFWEDYHLPTPYLLVYGGLGLAAGVWLGHVLREQGVFTCAATDLIPDIRGFFLPMALLVPFLWWGRQRRGPLILGVVVLAVLLGITRYLAHPYQPCFGPHALVHEHANSPYDRPRVMEGVIVGYPVLRESYAQYWVDVQAIWHGEEKRPVVGRALVRSDARDFHYGDRVEIRGVPITPPHPGFRRYLARKGAYTLIPRAELYLLDQGEGNPLLSVLYDIRGRGSALLSRLMPEPYAALANGMILGIESGIPRELYAQFNLTGASHVIVISGSNIALVSGVLMLITSWLLRGRRTIAAMVTLTGIGFYVLLVGADAAVVRAGIMGGLVVLAMVMNRQSTALVSLFFAGGLMLLMNPLTLWDVGFQLSFLATLGLILFSHPLQARWDAWAGRRLPRLVNNVLVEGLLITIAAQISTMPLVVHTFGRLSLSSFIVNLLILPVQPPILIGGGLALLLAAVFFPLGQLIALIPWASLWWTVFVVQRMAALPWGSLEIGPFGRMVAGLYYAAFAAGFLLWLFRQEQGAREFIPRAYRPVLVHGVLLAGVLLVTGWTGATAWAAHPDGKLHIQVWNQEGGTAWYLQTPRGRRVFLLASAPHTPTPWAVMDAWPGVRQPLDLLILETPDPPGSLQARAWLPPDATFAAGTRIQLDDQVTLTLLAHPPGEPRLFHLTYRRFSLVFPFMHSQETQAQWLQQKILPPVTVLITPWPGTHAWPHPHLLTALRPQILLQPQGTTYPPSVQRVLDAYPTRHTIPADRRLEIITDGEQVLLRGKRMIWGP